MTDPVLSEEPVPLLAETALVSHAAFLAASGRPFDEVVAGATEGLQCLWPGAKGLGFLFVDEIGRVLRPHPSCRGLSPDDLEPAPSDQAPVEAPIGRVLRSGEAMRSGNPDSAGQRFGSALKVGSAMAAPLLLDQGAPDVARVRARMPSPTMM
jgi:hypothetical protein